MPGAEAWRMKAVSKGGQPPRCRLVQETPPRPRRRLSPRRSPYGVSKVFAHWMAINYRKAMGCTFPTASCSTTSRPPRRELRHPQDTRRVWRSRRGRPRAAPGGTSTPSATGVCPGLRRGPCGRCWQQAQPDDTWWPPERRTRSGSSWKRPSPTWPPLAGPRGGRSQVLPPPPR